MSYGEGHKKQMAAVGAGQGIRDRALCGEEKKHHAAILHELKGLTAALQRHVY